MNKVLITGGAGFIGSHLSRYLVNSGCKVTVIDDLSIGRNINVPEQTKLIVDNVKNIVNYENMDFDTIFHLASIADYDKYIKKPYKTFDTNVNGMLAVLQLAEKTGARVVFTSSSEIYGSSDKPVRESDFHGVNPYTLRGGYTEGKRTAEMLCKVFSKKVNVTVLRLFNVYGKEMISRVINTFATQLKNEQPITICGDGLQTRSFTYIDDVIKALTMKLNRDVYNVGNPEPISISNLAKTISNILNIPIKDIEYIDNRIDEPRHRIPNIDKIKMYGWQPHIKLDTGLRRVLQ